MTTTVALWVCGCQSGLDYTDADLAQFDSLPRGTRLPFVTKKGNQLAFYVAPKDKKNPPDRLIMMFPGIGSRALDRLDWITACPVENAGFLMVDYPGRGRCEGVLQPSRLPSTTTGALKALADHLGVSRESLLTDIRAVGHSFGCGAALQFAADTPVNRLVLLAPFTTMKRALFRKMGPLAWLIPDNLDNRDNLKRVLAQRTIPPITIIHGRKDSTIPVAMAEELRDIAPDKVDLIVIETGTHVSTLTENVELIFRLLYED